MLRAVPVTGTLRVVVLRLTEPLTVAEHTATTLMSFGGTCSVREQKKEQKFEFYTSRANYKCLKVASGLFPESSALSSELPFAMASVFYCVPTSWATGRKLSSGST